MGNNMMSSVIKVFDRSHLEIESISAKIDRAQINGCREKHEVFVENISIFHSNSVKCMENSHRNDEIQVYKFVHKPKLRTNYRAYPSRVVKSK